ncbi:hypothetical protein KM043_017857 [Ampulex compressa]|nr:hypothetical protein KM043_017857 [Ampulex compressa]
MPRGQEKWKRSACVRADSGDGLVGEGGTIAAGIVNRYKSPFSSVQKFRGTSSIASERGQCTAARLGQQDIRETTARIIRVSEYRRVIPR